MNSLHNQCDGSLLYIVPHSQATSAMAPGPGMRHPVRPGSLETPKSLQKWFLCQQSVLEDDKTLDGDHDENFTEDGSKNLSKGHCTNDDSDD